jgi:DUF2075 family protein
MASTYVNDLRLNEMATGDASGSWGTVTNTNLELIGEAFSYGTETIGDADSTLTIADGAADAARSFYLKITSSVDLTTTRIVTLAPNTVSKVWMIENATTGSQVITIKQGSGATINVPNGQVKMIATDGAGSGGAVLDLLVDVDLTGTTTLVNLDVSGAVDIAGDLTLSAGGDGALRFTAASSVKVLDNDAAALVFEEADNAYMTFVTTDGSEAVKFDKALDINAATQIDATVTVGVDDTGYDVKFFGATTGKSLLWDESADSLIVTGSTSLQGGLEVGVDDTGYDVKFFGATTGKSLLWDESADSLIVTGTTTLVGTTNLDAVDIDGATQIDATVTVGVDDTGYDVKFFGATAGAYMLWDESADDLILGGAAGLSVNSTALVTGVLTTTAATVSNGGGQFNGAINVGVDDTGYDVKFFGATAGKYMLWDESADTLEVSGTVVAGAGTALLPSITTTGDLNTGMWFPAADTIAFSEGGVEALRIDSSGRLGLNITPSATTAFTVFQNRYLSLYGFDQNQSHILTNTYYPVDNGDYKRQETGYAQKLSMNSGKYIFNIGASGAADSVIAFTQAMTLDDNGNLLVGKTTTSVGTAGTLIAPMQTKITNDAATPQITTNNLGWGGVSIDFLYTGARKGYINVDSTSVAYNTSSDYRLKTDAQPMVGASARVLALKPVNFEWISDGSRVDGFLAHEAQAVVPECVTGTKDAMRDEEYEVTAAVLDADGTVVTEAVMGTRSVPDYQGIDQSKLVPLLTAALQEALNKIDAMEIRLSALEG